MEVPLEGFGFWACVRKWARTHLQESPVIHLYLPGKPSFKLDGLRGYVTRTNIYLQDSPPTHVVVPGFDNFFHLERGELQSMFTI